MSQFDSERSLLTVGNSECSSDHSLTLQPITHTCSAALQSSLTSCTWPAHYISSSLPVLCARLLFSVMQNTSALTCTLITCCPSCLFLAHIPCQLLVTKQPSVLWVPVPSLPLRVSVCLWLFRVPMPRPACFLYVVSSPAILPMSVFISVWRGLKEQTPVPQLTESLNRARCSLPRTLPFSPVPRRNEKHTCTWSKYLPVT